MSQDLLKKAGAVIEELDQLIMDEKIFLLHDYYPFMMDEDDIKDVEEMITAGKNNSWDEYIKEQKRKREIESIEEARKKSHKFELEQNKKRIEEDRAAGKKRTAYKKVEKPENYIYSDEEKKEIIARYDKLLKKRTSQLQPGSTASMIGHSLMNKTRNELLKKNMFRKMNEAILNRFIWVKNYSKWQHSYIKNK